MKLVTVYILSKQVFLVSTYKVCLTKYQYQISTSHFLLKCTWYQIGSKKVVLVHQYTTIG